MIDVRQWVPASLLAVGCIVNGAVVMRRSGPVPLRAPIATVAPVILNARAVDDTVDSEQRRVAGMSSYVLRHYEPVGVLPFDVYVGYYDEQRQGKTIHSPKNCLPGAGWEQVQSGAVTIATPGGPVVVNRYRVAGAGGQALVYYWYQGRGRVAHDEFRVKWELLRDAALRGRTEEALVRIVVPFSGSDDRGADRVAREVVPTLISSVNTVLPVY